MIEQFTNAAGFALAMAIGTIAKLSFDWWTVWFKTKRDKEKIPRELDRNFDVQERLAILRDRYSASRAKVFQFHNGEYYFNGTGIEKFSMTNISVRPGIAYPYKFKEFYSSQPISQSLELIKPICENEAFFLKTSDLPDHSGWKDVFRFNEIKSHLFAKIEHNGKIEGFISVSWHEDMVIEIDPTEIIKTAEQIGILLRRRK
ncbi:hypothetical protein [Leptospira stimsonii]|uniref:hypothetical protein n=1 Tax=Leptospira stimsonii TaxID=2202203 RepID=UPI001FF073A8|nr:hypothetical protein [Leptospira stimsonii]